FRDHRVDLRRRRRLPDRGPEQADVELTAVGELLVGLIVLGPHAAPAGVKPRGQPQRVEIADELAGVASQASLVSWGMRAATKATPPAPRTSPLGLPLASLSIVPPCGLGVEVSILAAV